MAAGNAPSSFVSDLLEELDGDDFETEQIIQRCAGVAYGAGSDTMVAALASFTLAMVMFPEVQKKAQSELDTVVGLHRLPTFADKPSLPYITACMKEVTRWHTTSPLGLPHFIKVDDVYNGYHIPAGSTVLGNTWAILHDEHMYPEPMVFKPERYFVNGRLDFSSNDPGRFAFGYGRRICAGNHFTENTLWIAIAQTLSVLNFDKAHDNQGREIPVELVPSPGMICHPEPFKCSITPRSEEARSLILETNGLTFK